ncbi:TlpA family protein disulfide reductase [Mucilaginibacter paludis]|uniref:Thioredoxin domain-containing protein n=1 Tax=Mucilaginibacter paludis DSM 18603 TaxID=714943 RepID=H1YBU7_9SPHI|nr:hypothetical protein [Mucilaginibacter paludis]EHQ27025.1 hypothetical protein Mucpa_2917 [Mucilaginibacter paludis DSM 18603]
MNKELKYAGFTVMLFATIVFSACKGDPKASLPEFSLLLPDSTTILNTKDIPDGKPIAIIHFNADCENCQKETEQILSHMDSLKQVQFYFLTTERFERLKVFNQHYKLKNYPNITAGQDFNSFYPAHIQNWSTPLMALYDGDKKLRIVYKGAPPMSDLIKKVAELQ